MADGKGCKCMAYSESECACDVDWTPQEIYDLRAENKQLKEAIRRLAEQDATLSVCNGNVIVEMDATLTDEEREAVKGVLMGRDHLVIHDVWKEEWKQNCDTLRGLLERTK